MSNENLARPASSDGEMAGIIPPLIRQTDGEPSDGMEKSNDESEMPNLAKELFELLENNFDDATGSEVLSDKLEKLKAANNDDNQFLKKLVTTTQEGCKTTLLHLAAEKGLKNVAKQLIKEGADVNAQDDAGNQPLHLACQAGNDEVANCLLDATNYEHKHNKDGRYPLHEACFLWNSLQLDTVRRLCGSSLSCINEKDEISGWTPINRAVYWGKEEIVDILLEENPRLDIEDSDKWTPLITAVREGYYGIFNKLVDHLNSKKQIDDRVDEDYKNAVDKKDDSGMTALMLLGDRLSEQSESFDEPQKSIDNMLKLRPDFNILNDDGQTALYYFLRFASSIQSTSKMDVPAKFLERIAGMGTEDTPFIQFKANKDAFDPLFDDSGVVKILESFAQALLKSCQKNKAIPDLLSWLALRPERHAFANHRVIKETEAYHKPQPGDLGKWAISSKQPGCLLNYVQAISQKEKSEQSRKEDRGRNGNDHASVKSQDVREHLKEWIKHLEEYEEKAAKPSGQSQGPKAYKQHSVEKSGGEEEQSKGSHKLPSKAEPKPGKGQRIEANDKGQRDPYYQDMEDIIDLFCAGKAPTFRESMEVSKLEGSMGEIMKEFYASIIQVRQEQNEVGIYTKCRTVHHVIHGNESLDTVQDIMKRWNGPESNLGDTSKEFTWIHLPSANMVWMHDMLKRISTKSNYKNEKFQELAFFLRASWVQIPDKEIPSRFMRPRYVEKMHAMDEHQDKEKEEEKKEEEESTDESTIDKDPRPRPAYSALYASIFAF
ncbi:ankyrin repeat [Fusarium pseudocircinatum]|uniref:Ankyrin repeat n=1 Tax=Fusarium pseudocircinatum TaxID=56676 RepID=A0A8H5KGB1_9HYPO|nr:ankyrin repeat [Fusarium pseudocircinatum]